MQIIKQKYKQSSIISETLSTAALSLCLSNNRQQQQVKCNMLLELNAINNTNNNSNSSENKSDNNVNDNNNYTDIATDNKQICGCISTSGIYSSCCLSCSSSSSSTATAAACCHSNCCLMSEPSSTASTTRAISNYMYCANLCKMYTTNNNNNDSVSKICSNNDYVIPDNTHCNNISISSSCSITTRGIGLFNRLHRNISNINKSLNGLIKFAIILIFLAMCDSSESTLTNVNLYIEPPAVRRSQSVILRCQYTLEGAPLYSVKFYRGQLEFFRYTPGEYPNTKVFHYPGIKVDESVSNATQVVIRNVNFGLSGNFSCEVTADAPLFSTATAYAQMQVVEFPDKRPQLFTEHTRYEPGDVLRANCSTPPSRPRAELRFTINNIPVSSEETQYIRTVDNLIASRLSLKVQLQAIHFATSGASASAGVGVSTASASGNSNSHMINALSPGGTVRNPASTTTYGSGSGASGGALLLRCTAQIGDLYQEYKEIELGTPQRDPVPARVTSSGGGFQSFLDTYFGPSSGASPMTERQPYNILLIINCILILLVSSMCVRR